MWKKDSVALKDIGLSAPIGVASGSRTGSGALLRLPCAGPAVEGSAGECIAEIVLHAAYRKHVARRRLLGDRRGSFPRLRMA